MSTKNALLSKHLMEAKEKTLRLQSTINDEQQKVNALRDSLEVSQDEILEVRQERTGLQIKLELELKKQSHVSMQLLLNTLFHIVFMNDPPKFSLQ